MRTVRIGVLHPYWSFWEGSAGPRFLADRERLAREAEATLAEHGRVEWSTTVEPGADPGELPSVDIVAVVCTLACPPSQVLAALAAQPDAVVLVWGAVAEEGLPRPFDHGGITRRGATVGAPMLCAALAAAGRAFDVVTGETTGSVAVDRALRAAVAAARVRTATVGVVGGPLPGYGFTALPSAGLHRLGTRILPLSEHAFGEAVRADLDDGAPDPALDRATAYCRALDALTAERRLDAGTLNCHVDSLRLHPRLGSAPCLALGRSTSAGVPWTCTGDVATAFAMLVVASLGAPTLYHEIEAVDPEADAVVLANSGEHDGRLDGVGGDLVVNPWYPGGMDTLIRAGTVEAGPATLVAARADGDDIRLVVAEGEFTGEGHPATGTVNAVFRFSRGRAVDSWAAWARSGVSHHSCATDRHLAEELQLVARHLSLGIDVV